VYALQKSKQQRQKSNPRKKHTATHSNTQQQKATQNNTQQDKTARTTTKQRQTPQNNTKNHTTTHSNSMTLPTFIQPGAFNITIASSI
jgi:hypothetical protein